MYDFISSAIRDGGYVGIFFLMVLETVIPPIPSEIVLSLAGIQAATGNFNVLSVIVVGTFGSTAGQYVLYLIARLIPEKRVKTFVDRHGRWLAMTTDDFDRSTRYFRERGSIAIVIGRFVPVVRSLISLPAGFARMPVLWFLTLSFCGSLVWNTGLVYAGFALESHLSKIQSLLEWITTGVIVGAIVFYLLKVIRYPQKR